MLSFEELTEARRSLKSFCLLQVPSLLSLQSGISFKLSPTEDELGNEKVRHLTTTATCLTSLSECPQGLWGTADRGAVDGLRSTFAEKALHREWKSEKSAVIYCRCRALPTVITASGNFPKQVNEHLETIFFQLKERPERFAIGEADPAAREKSEWYPPNGFHTYWTLEILNYIERKFKTNYDELCTTLQVDARRRGMIIWARQQLGYQIGLHSASPPSSLLDSDQLAWSLAIFLRFDGSLTVNLESRDFVKQALKCLFSTQTDGTWRHYKPLFHYSEAGNAYCYVFETFAVLLHSALLESAEAKMVRDLLRPYCKHLLDLWRYADSTKIDLRKYGKGTGNEVGWCSGHRTNVTDPESWATASVFSYAQALRRLIGIWCREEALTSLNTPHARSTVEKASDKILSHGTTWGRTRAQLSDQLWTMFINPVRMHNCVLECGNRLEPDSRPVEEKHARSAILFGPPGTGKTTLVRSLADVIGWEYVELHASHFVAEGLPQVQKTADNIFKRLSELDHTVVLFDEIDELVRERDIERDAFGRFLTTSMLPKLAELWEARKLLYFVATNHINYFDSAIIRSHRFDALILVSPPSFDAKVRQLRSLLSRVHGISITQFDVTEPDIQKNVVQAGTVPQEVGDTEHAINQWREKKLDPQLSLAKFALLRWDELDELAYRLAVILKRQSPVQYAISQNLLLEALKQIADSQWRKNKSYLDYIRDTESERRDYQMLNVWEVTGTTTSSIPGVVAGNGARWFAKAGDPQPPTEIPGFEVIALSPGRLEIQQSGRQ